MADLQNIIYQMVLSLLRDSKFTSASPGHINKFIGVNVAATTIGTDEEIRAAILEIINSEGVGKEKTGKDLASDLSDVEVETEKVKDFEKKAVLGTRRALAIAQNPASLVSQGILLLPHAVLVAFAISIVPFIFEELTRAGGPLDLRFKRIVDEEISAFLSRQSQRDTEMGVRQVIIQSKTGFTATNGSNNFNTLRGIREGGIDKELLDRVGKVDHAKGVFDFG